MTPISIARSKSRKELFNYKNLVCFIVSEIHNRVMVINNLTLKVKPKKKKQSFKEYLNYKNKFHCLDKKSAWNFKCI